MTRSQPLPLPLPLLLPLLLLLLTAGAAAQKLGFGPCPKIFPVSNFNINAYSGLWYENRKFPAIFQLGQKCVTARYSVNLGGFISVENSGYLISRPTRAYGYAYLTGAPNVGALAVGFPDPQDRDVANYNVIRVDYDRYAVVYSCSNVLGSTSHVELLWLLTRQITFPDEEADEITRSLMAQGITKAYLMQTTDQNFCPGRNNIFFAD